MPLRRFTVIPVSSADWERMGRDVEVIPNNNSVSTATLVNASVTDTKLASDSVTTAKIATDAVTTAKIVAASVTDAKLAPDAVTTAKILNAAVTFAKIQDIATARLVGRSTAGTGSVELLTATTPLSIAGGALVLDTSVYVAAADVLNGSATYDPPSLTTLTGATTTVTCTGAVLGDHAMASFSVDLQGISVSAYVSSADTVSVRFFNGTAGTLDLASGTLRARVWKQ